MFADLLQQLQGMTLDERVEAITTVIDDPRPADERGELSILLAQANLRLGRPSAVQDVVNREVAADIPGRAKVRLLEYRAHVEVDRADEVAALATLGEMEALGVPDIGLPRYYYLKARCLALQKDADAFEWFRLAVCGYIDAGRTQEAAVPATWAALTAVDWGQSPEPWLQWIPETDPYRLAVAAEMALQAGDPAGADGLARQSLAAHESPGQRSYLTHAHARATFALAQVAPSTEGAMMLLERALSLATASTAGYEPLLVERIRRFKRTL